MKVARHFDPHKTGDVNEFEREKTLLLPRLAAGGQRAENLAASVLLTHPHEAAKQRSCALRSFIPSLPVALTHLLTRPLPDLIVPALRSSDVTALDPAILLDPRSLRS